MKSSYLKKEKKMYALYNVLSINTKKERVKYDADSGSNPRKHSLHYCNSAVVALGGATN